MNKKLFNILIIGSGNIGKYHLKGISSLSKTNIFVVEKNKKTIKKLKLNNKKFKNVNFYEKIINFNRNIDLVILATPSNERLKIISEVIKKNKIKYFIVEKVVSQTYKEFKKIRELFTKSGIKDFINFPRRYYKIYDYVKKNLKTRNKKKDKISIIKYGSNWNLGSNIFHFIDLFCYLTNNYEIKISEHKLEKTLFLSKRKGYKEFRGSIKIHNSNGDKLLIEDHKDNIISNKMNMVCIEFKNKTFIVLEFINLLIELNSSDKNYLNYTYFKTPKQSHLTKSIVNNLIKKKKCDLPSFQETENYHKTMLNFFLKFIKKINKNIRAVPIT